MTEIKFYFSLTISHPMQIMITPNQNTVLLILNLNFLNNLSLAIILKATSRHLVQSQNLLVGVLNQDILALVTLETHVGNRTHDTPAVREREIHLLREVAGLPAHDTEDHVAVVCLGVCAGDESISVNSRFREWEKERTRAS